MGTSKKVVRGAGPMAALLVLALVASGCADPGEPAEAPAARDSGSVVAPAPPAADSAAPPSPGPSPGVTPEPEVAIDTIMIEGSPEEVHVRLVTSPADFPLPFTARVPVEMRLDRSVSSEGAIVRFEAAFGGVHNPEAFLALHVPNGDAVAALVERLGGREDETRRFDWSTREFRLEGERAGFIAEGERAGRRFLLVLAYPPEYGDGMGPRVDLILRSWRWEDGSPLGG